MAKLSQTRDEELEQSRAECCGARTKDEQAASPPFFVARKRDSDLPCLGTAGLAPISSRLCDSRD